MTRSQGIGVYTKMRREAIKESNDVTKRLLLLEAAIDDLDVRAVNERLKNTETNMKCLQDDARSNSIIPIVLSALGVIIAVMLGIYAILLPSSYSKDTVDEKIKSIYEKISTTEQRFNEKYDALVKGSTTHEPREIKE